MRRLSTTTQKDARSCAWHHGILFQGQSLISLVNLGRSRHQAELVLAHVVQEGVFVGRLHDDGFMSKALSRQAASRAVLRQVGQVGQSWPPPGQTSTSGGQHAPFRMSLRDLRDAVILFNDFYPSPTEAYIVLAYIHIVIICIYLYIL